MLPREISAFSLVSALLCAVSALDETVYFKLGGSLTVSPKSVPPTIDDITWKCSGDVVAEYFASSVPLAYLGRFKGHASMDVKTGELKLSNMAAHHAGRYSVEINSRIHPDGFNAVLMPEVPVPKVDVEPLACTKVMDQCVLVCGGDVAKAGPVSYFWRMDDKDWTPGQERLPISGDTEAEAFSCKLENPVSSHKSEPFPNPFRVSTGGGGGGARGGGAGGGGAVLGGVICGLLAAAAAVALVSS